MGETSFSNGIAAFLGYLHLSPTAICRLNSLRMTLRAKGSKTLELRYRMMAQRAVKFSNALVNSLCCYYYFSLSWESAVASIGLKSLPGTASSSSMRYSTLFLRRIAAAGELWKHIVCLSRYISTKSAIARALMSSLGSTFAAFLALPYAFQCAQHNSYSTSNLLSFSLMLT